jgi:hypothetical protein
MIRTDTTLTIRQENVVHETVDDEVVIVDLANGVYFSTDSVGAIVWGHLAAGTNLQQLSDWARATFPTQPDAPDEVSMFVRQVHAHNLLIESTTNANGSLPTGEPSTYETPTLHAFNDMESLLLLDPIHDVEADKGWPNVR